MSATISLWYFAYFAFVGIFVPFFPVYLDHLGLSIAQIGSVIAAGQAMRIAIPAVWGWASDRVGRRVPLIRGSAILSILVFSGFFTADNFVALMLVTGILYAAWSGAHPLVEAVTFAHLASTPGHYGRIRLWGSVGFVVAVLAGGWYLDGRAIAQMLWLALGSLLLVGLAALAMSESPAVSTTSLLSQPAEKLRLDRATISLLIAAALMSVAHGPLYAFLSLHLADAGYSRSMIGWLWALGVFAEIAVFVWQPAWSRRWPVRAVLLACFVMGILRFWLLAEYVAVIALVIVAQLLHGATFGAHHVATASALSRWFPAAMQGRIQALYGSFSFGAGGMLGAYLGGQLWQATGPEPTYLFAAACSALGLLVIWFGLPEERADQQAAR